MARYSRYNSFNKSGICKIVPFIKIPKKNSDIYDYYFNTRLDLLSYRYYDNANYGWLIMQANPEYGSLEFNIPRGALLRIPYPLDITISQYEDEIKKHKTLYEK